MAAAMIAPALPFVALKVGGVISRPVAGSSTPELRDRDDRADRLPTPRVSKGCRGPRLWAARPFHWPAASESGRSVETTGPSPRVHRCERSGLRVSLLVVPERGRSMKRARIALALVALATGIAVVFVVAHEGKENVLDAVLGVGIGWSFVAAGLVAWARRPESAIGRVMVFAGLLRLAAELSTGSGQQVLGPVGHLMHDGFLDRHRLCAARLSERAPGRPLNRWLLAGAVLMLPLDLAWFLLGGDRVERLYARVGRPEQWSGVRGRTGGACPPARGDRTRRPADAARDRGRREDLRRATPRFRVAIAPVIWTGAAGFAFMLDARGRQRGQSARRHPGVVLDLTLQASRSASWSASCALGWRARRWPSWSSSSAGQPFPATCRRPGAGAAGSVARTRLLAAGWRSVRRRRGPAVRVADRERDEHGLGGRARGRKIAALVHDPALNEESGSSSRSARRPRSRSRTGGSGRAEGTARGAAGLTRPDRGSGGRGAARIERNLHDGTQQRLVSISMALGLAQAKLEKDPAAASAVFGEARRAFGRARGAARAEPRDSSGGPHRARTRRGAPRALLHAAVPVELALDGAERLPSRSRRRPTTSSPKRSPISPSTRTPRARRCACSRWTARSCSRWPTTVSAERMRVEARACAA